jgi:hypothetical protein
MRELSDREILPHPASRQPRKRRFAGGSRVRGTYTTTTACGNLTEHDSYQNCQLSVVDMRAFTRLVEGCETLCYRHSSSLRKSSYGDAREGTVKVCPSCNRISLLSLS